MFETQLFLIGFECENLRIIIKNMRNYLLKKGTEIHFNKRVDDLIIKDNTIQGVITSDNEEYIGDAVILATGHSQEIPMKCFIKIIFNLKRKILQLEHELNTKLH